MVDDFRDLEEDGDDEFENLNKISKRKILVFLIPVLIVIAIVVGLFISFRETTVKKSPYNVITQTSDDGKEIKTTVFFDLPEVTVKLKGDNDFDDKVKIRLSLELSSIDDAKNIEILTSRLVDSIISHTSELTTDEIETTSNLYWLKEELLYRINLIVSPIKISNINFKTFEVQKQRNEGQ